MNEATNMIRAIQKQGDRVICCPEKIAFDNNIILLIEKILAIRFICPTPAGGKGSPSAFRFPHPPPPTWH